MLSISDKLTYNFKNIIIPFEKVGDYTSRYCYSSSSYVTTHRHKDNIKSLGNVLIYDFDDGAITISQLLMFLLNNEITSVITTTKSHQKNKGDKPAVDRFRLFLPLDRELKISISEYPLLYMYVAKLLNIDDIIDTSCRNPSRSYYPNPEQEIFFTPSGKILNGKFLTEQMFRYLEKSNKENKKAPLSNNNKASINNTLKIKCLRDNEVDLDTLIELSTGERYPLKYFGFLKVNETVPCRCINPLHEDRNPSAFVGRSHTSGRLMVKCSSCCSLYFASSDDLK